MGKEWLAIRRAPSNAHLSLRALRQANPLIVRALTFLTLLVALLTNSSLSAIAAPTLTAVTVESNGTTLVFDAVESINSAANMPGGVSATIDGVAVSVGNPSGFLLVGGSYNYSFTLGRTVLPGQTVLVTYAPTASVYLSTPAGQLLAFSNLTATNNSTVAPDLTAPTLTSAALSANGLNLVLTYNETLGANSNLPTTFTVTVDGSPVTVSASAKTVSGSTLTIPLASAVWAGKVVTVSYVAPTPNAATSNAAIQDVAGNDAVSFTNVAVTNNSTAGPDITPPKLAATTPVSYSGTQVTVAFNEALATSPAPLATSFAVFVAGVLETPTAVSISGSNVLLTLATTPATGSEVIVEYVAPTVDATTGNAAIQDTSGNDALSFNATSKSMGSAWTYVVPATGTATTGGAPNCDGAGWNDRAKQTTLPNGTIMTVGVSGPNVCINDVTESLAARGGAAGDFVANALVNEPGLKITTSNANCAAGAVCSRGQLKFSFSQPVVNPVISFAGWGGGTGSTTAWTELGLTTPGATMNVLSGTNISTSVGGTYLSPTIRNPAAKCHITSGYGATAQAGCGSIRINGTYTTIDFNVFMGNNNGVGYMDAWNLNMNVAEDFGLVPTTYDVPAASHVVTDLRLGATVAPDQASALYSTTNIDAVPRWTSLANNAKADDGVAAWVTSPTLSFGPAGSTYSTTMALNGVTQSAYICSWIDFNRDEVFAFDERSCATLQTGDTSVTLNWTVPTVVAAGLTYTRVRLSFEQVVMPTGKLGSGEVEDYSITIASASTAVRDTSINNKGVTQNIDILNNDLLLNNTTWNLSTLRLCDAGQTPNNCNATSVTTTSGTYTLDTSTGIASFVPLASFTGVAVPISYQVTDSSGATSSTTINPTVRGVPLANPDTTSGPLNTAQTINLLTNTSGADVASPGSSLTATSVKLCDLGEVAPACSATTVTVTGVGVYSVSTSGVMTFTPETGYVGTPTALPYTVTDSTNQVASSTYTPTVYALGSATPDMTSGPLNTAQTSNVWANDTASSTATLVNGSVKLCAAGTTTNCSLTSLTVTGQGTYSVSPTTGAITFSPVTGFTGTATAVRYAITDSRGLIVNTTYTPTIVPGPVAVADVSSGPQDVNQTKSLLTNDSAATGTSLNQGSVKLCGTGEVAPNCAQTSVTVAGEGTYTVDASGVVTFDPLPNFTGTATPISYTVTDLLGQKASSTYTPSVFGNLTAVLDTSIGPLNTPQVKSVLANDAAGFGATLNTGSVLLCGQNETAPNCSQTTVSVGSDGSYSVDGSGVITFTPRNNFTGVATPITYSVVDSLYSASSPLEHIAYATYTPTVVGVPTAVLDASSGPYNTAQTMNVLTNDSAATGAALVVSSVKLCGSGETGVNCSKTSVVTDQGTYTVGVTGIITFTPLPEFTGAARGITYSVADSIGQVVYTTYTPTVGPPPAPAAVADTSIGLHDINQTLFPLANDTAGTSAFPLVIGSLRLCAPATNLVSAETSPNCTALAVTIDGVGSYSIDTTDGSVIFNPLSTFDGTAPALGYQVSDSSNRTVSSTITPTVIPMPTANPDVSGPVPFGNAQTISPLTNDSAAAGYQLNDSTLKFCAITENPDHCTQTTGSITTVDGTYLINGPTVIFTPAIGFSGTATAPLKYQVADSLGQISSSTITPRVTPPLVATANPDTSIAGWDTNQTLKPIANDVPTQGSVWVLSSLRLCDPSQPAPCSALSVTIPLVGTYSIDTTDGSVIFNPLASFVGTPTALSYDVTDSYGNVSTSTLTPTVTVAPPVANPETKTVLATQNAVFTTIFGTTGLVSPGETPVVTACLGDSTITPSTCAGTVTVQNQGTYTLDPVTGIVTFVPVAGLVGGTALTPISYLVTDSVGQFAISTLTVVTPPPPTARPNVSYGAYETPQIISILGNDSPGAASAPLVSNTMKLCPLGANVFDAATCNLGTVTTPEGVYSVDATDFSVVFTPVALYSGPPVTANGVTTISEVANPIHYIVQDSLGQLTSSTITPTVFPQPATAAMPDFKTVLWTPTVTASVNPLANDLSGTAPAGFTLAGTTALNATSVKLCAANEAVPNCSLLSLTTAEGVYTVDPVTGQITFDPIISFIGTASVVPTYQVCNVISGTWEISGQVATPNATCASSTFTPTITPPPLPAAVPDVTSGLEGAVQSINLVSNSVATSDTLQGVPLKSAHLCALGQLVGSCTATTVVVPLQGTFTINPATGAATFTPLPNFVGTATPLSYDVIDVMGRTTSSTYTPTVTPVTGPTATPETKYTIPGVPVSFTNITGSSSPLATQGTGPITVSRTCLIDPAHPANCSSTVLTAEGIWTLNSTTGVVSYLANLGTPRGTQPSITYQVTDSYGKTATSTLTPILPEAPTATPDVNANGLNVVQLIDVLGNDLSNSGLTLNVASVKFCGPLEVAPNCSLSTITVAGKGTFTVSPTTGVVTFTPVNGFFGNVPPVTYSVANSLGERASSTITVTVTNNPAANPDTTSGVQGAVQTATLITNDNSGSNPLASVFLCGVGQSGLACNQTTVTVANVGTYVLNSVTGVITFTPLATFLGTAPALNYVIQDTLGNYASSTYTPTVTAPPPPPTPAPSTPSPSSPTPSVPTPTTPTPTVPVKPVTPVQPLPVPIAKPDVKSGKLNQVIAVTPVLNDVKAGVPLIPTSIVLYIASPTTPNIPGIPSIPTQPANPANPTSPANPSAEIPVAAAPIVTAQGTWSVVAGTGQVSFKPVLNWFGRATISYTMLDEAGNLVKSTITVVIPKPKSRVLPKTLVYTGDVAPSTTRALTKLTAIAPVVASLKQGTYFATIRAPRLGANWSKKIFEGTSVAKVLTPLGLGHYETTEMPGEPGNFAIAGHRFGSGGPFLNIDKFQAGDLVYVTTKTGTFTYRYLQTKVVKPSAVGVLAPRPQGLTATATSDAFLTLQTCTPVHVNTDRLIVWFELVK